VHKLTENFAMLQNLLVSMWCCARVQVGLEWQWVALARYLFRPYKKVI